jgi:hypothetical protein
MGKIDEAVVIECSFVKQFSTIGGAEPECVFRTHLFRY